MKHSWQEIAVPFENGWKYVGSMESWTEIHDVLLWTAKTFAMIDITWSDLPEVYVPFGMSDSLGMDARKTENRWEISIDPVIGKPSEDDLYDLDFVGNNSEPKNEPVKELAKLTKNTKVLVSRLEKIKGTLEWILPNFLHSQLRGDVMADISQQEAEWDTMELGDMVIRGEEVSMWSELLSNAKRSDFIPQKTVTELERGEIVELIIDGFESFRIVKIRTRDKEGYSLSVIEFERESLVNKNPQNKRCIKAKGSYLMRLPLLEGGVISLLNNKMECVASHKIQRIFLNKQQGSLLKGFFKLLS